MIDDIQMEWLKDCTGTKSLAIYSHGHTNDTSYPCFGGMGGTEEFCVDVLGKTPGELRACSAMALAEKEVC
jgi:hypothetical protein